jgi:CTP:molybdopterin cytidylyltransferase MocA
LVRPATVVCLNDSRARAAIPRFRGKHGHPVVFDRATAEAVVSGDLAGPTLREVLRAVGAVDVDVDDPGTVANCNTPDALRRALSLIP